MSHTVWELIQANPGALCIRDRIELEKYKELKRIADSLEHIKEHGVTAFVEPDE